MKKRILSLILVLALLITTVPSSIAHAAEDNTATVSEWAIDDLMTGDTYGIYPQTWYDKGMNTKITEAQLRVLIAGLRTKIVKSGCMEKELKNVFDINEKITVKEVLNVLHDVITSYRYTKDIGLKNYSALNFMKEYGIYTGKNGELGLNEICTKEQACVIVTRLVTYLYDVLDAGSKGFLWKVQSGGNTVYMLGSIHMASCDIYPFSKEMLEAFQESDALAVEANLFNIEGYFSFMQLAVYSDGSTLKDHVSEETYEKTVKLAEELGFTEDEIIMLKPWYLYTLFSTLSNAESGDLSKAGSAAALGIDLYFTTTALYTGKPILEVEGSEYQGKVLDSFSDELDEYLLSGAADAENAALSGDYSVGADYLDLMLEYWKDGNTEAFKELTSPDEELPELNVNYTEQEKELNAEFNDKLMTQRDKHMADYIDDLLKSEGSSTYFVVVGSGHFISNYSVLDILKEKGYEISQIK